MVVHTNHSPLWHLPIRKYEDLEVACDHPGIQSGHQHIFGKVKASDHLSYQSLDQAIGPENVARAENDIF